MGSLIRPNSQAVESDLSPPERFDALYADRHIETRAYLIQFGGDEMTDDGSMGQETRHQQGGQGAQAIDDGSGGHD